MQERLDIPVFHDDQHGTAIVAAAAASNALRVAGTPTVTIELKEANRPGLFRAGAGFLYVVMPVNLA